ncbi:MAG: hypothetical protein FWD85_07155 [Microbacteriaceae bacterium]|nr:hypothetical protein [Microbacteriaceae bacterium]MCL2795068.1 hypothetical protein [Microbacteriaceae bacterium]
MSAAKVLATTITLVAAGCLVAGCAQSRGLDIPLDPQASPDPLTAPTDAAVVASLPPAQAEGLLSSAPRDPVSMPWRFLGLSADGRTVDVVYAAGDGGCVTHAGFAVAQTADTVVVEAISTDGGAHLPPGHGCADVYKTGRATITLPAAVGPGTSTSLEHAAVDGRWSNPAFLGDLG